MIIVINILKRYKKSNIIHKHIHVNYISFSMFSMYKQYVFSTSGTVLKFP